MIKNLDGIFETVDFQVGSRINLYDNNEYEDYPPHWHTAFEVIMTVEGTYKVICSGTEYTLQEGDILIVSPCAIHELFAPQSGRRIIFQPNTTGLNIEGLEALIQSVSPARLITSADDPDLHTHMREQILLIRDEFFAGEPYKDLLIMARFLKILAEYGRRVASRPVSDEPAQDAPLQKKYLEKFLLVEDYINEHFAEDLRLEDVAAMAGFSKYYFTRLFKQYRDTSFYKYLNQKRINYAKTLLPDPELTVLDVANRSGFSSPSAFWRMFRQLTGCTPAEFRNMYKW